VGEGAHVVAGARTTESLRGIDRVTAVAGDLASREGPVELIRCIMDVYGCIDVLVNNVGVARVRFSGFFGTSDEEFEWSMQMNFFSVVRASRAALLSMVKQGSGAIVNVASVNVFFELDAGVLDYGTAKTALLNFTKS